MRKDKVCKLLSLSLFVMGLVAIVNSGAEITGAVTGISGFATSSLVIGILLMLISGVLFLGALRLHKRRIIASSLYNVLITKDSIGHRTEQISDLEMQLSKDDVSKKDVATVIREEIRKGNLRADPKYPAVSVPRKRQAAGNILGSYRASLKPSVINRLEELKKGKLPEGTR